MLKDWKVSCLGFGFNFYGFRDGSKLQEAFNFLNKGVEMRSLRKQNQKLAYEWQRVRRKVSWGHVTSPSCFIICVSCVLDWLQTPFETENDLEFSSDATALTWWVLGLDSCTTIPSLMRCWGSYTGPLTHTASTQPDLAYTFMTGTSYLEYTLLKVTCWTKNI